MRTDRINEPTKAVFLQTVGIALGNLKQQLQHDYERAYPELREIIHLILDEEEARAWNLTSFPHLLLPDLVEARVAQLNLRPAETKRADLFATHERDQFEHNYPVHAICA
jgi:hypothetical protein